MILITGSLVARPETAAELFALSRAHCVRSRAEDGCIKHTVHLDADDPLRLVFIEHWRDSAAVMKHFADTHARTFSKAVVRLSARPPTLEIYEANEIGIKGLAS